MSNCAYIAKIKNIRKHSNANRLQCGTVLGNTVIVNLDVHEQELGIYFPSDSKIGIEYAESNNLLRKKDKQGNNCGGHLDPEKRNIRAMKLRGERSDGLFMPISSLSKFIDVNTLREGEEITRLGEVTICEKYVPKGRTSTYKNRNNQKKIKVSDKELYPHFVEHTDTNHLTRNLHQFEFGDKCVITLKLHGTSQRTSNTLRHARSPLPSWMQKILRFIGIKLKPKIQGYEYISGTRRTIMHNKESGYGSDNNFRLQHHDKFIGQLLEGESVFYEIVGYTSPGRTIMSSCSNKKTNDKDFIKQYGDTTSFTYNCKDGESQTYIYRMTKTDESGQVFEYPWELVKERSKQMGINHCPEFETFILTTPEDLIERVEKYWEGVDPIGKTHIREGVIVRIDNRERFTAYKHKSYLFKVLEGIIKESAEEPDIEEAEEFAKEIDHELQTL